MREGKTFEERLLPSRVLLFLTLFRVGRSQLALANWMIKASLRIDLKVRKNSVSDVGIESCCNKDDIYSLSMFYGSRVTASSLRKNRKLRMIYQLLHHFPVLYHMGSLQMRL